MNALQEFVYEFVEDKYYTNNGPFPFADLVSSAAEIWNGVINETFLRDLLGLDETDLMIKGDLVVHPDDVIYEPEPEPEPEEKKLIARMVFYV